jgi:AbrB family looped-hinge helix DNA binding protein
MKTTIDSAGRLVIPKEIRREAGIEPGMPLEVTLREGHIEIVPAPQRVRLVKKGRMLVAEPETDVPVLDAGTVDQTLKQLRQRRITSR